MRETYYDEIKAHYESVWANHCTVKQWQQGPVSDLPAGFCVLEFSPTRTRTMWTYATCGMSQPTDLEPVELHLFSPIQFDSHVELLTVVAHFHRTGSTLNLGHTVNFGRPWLPGSTCEFGLISLPYLDGPDLEHYDCSEFNCNVRFLWLVPITKQERDYKKQHGLEALETKFDEAQFDYLDASRTSVL